MFKWSNCDRKGQLAETNSKLLNQFEQHKVRICTLNPKIVDFNEIQEGIVLKKGKKGN